MKAVIALIAGIVKTVMFVVKGIFGILFFIVVILLLDHVICGCLGGLLFGLIKGGSGLFNLQLRSWGLGIVQSLVGKKEGP